RPTLPPSRRCSKIYECAGDCTQKAQAGARPEPAGRKIKGMALFTRAFALATPLLLTLVQARPADGNPASEALKLRASAELYNLNRAQAEATFREAIKADPQDAGAYRGL